MRTVDSIRTDFPYLKYQNGQKPIVYLDNAATMQIPGPVIDAINHHLESSNAVVHRSTHTLAEKSLRLYEDAREVVANYIHAPLPSNIVFTSSTTDSINLVVRALYNIVRKGDEILITIMEHHSNLIPWQQLCAHTGAVLRVVPLTRKQTLDTDCLINSINNNTRFIAVSHCSNVLGNLADIKRICNSAHKFGVPVLVDGAQAIAHTNVDVMDLNCDFYCFSGHKLMGPSGIGVLYGTIDALCSILPSRFGGGMTKSCKLHESIWEDVPQCFEAGTPNYIGATGLAAALSYRKQLGLEHIYSLEKELMQYLESALANFPQIQLLGEPNQHINCISFHIERASAFDVAMGLDQFGVATRSGKLCSEPLLEQLQIKDVVRVSPAFYNTIAELNHFLAALEKILKVLCR